MEGNDRDRLRRVWNYPNGTRGCIAHGSRSDADSGEPMRKLRSEEIAHDCAGGESATVDAIFVDAQVVFQFVHHGSYESDIVGPVVADVAKTSIPHNRMPNAIRIDDNEIFL